MPYSTYMSVAASSKGVLSGSPYTPVSASSAERKEAMLLSPGSSVTETRLRRGSRALLMRCTSKHAKVAVMPPMPRSTFESWMLPVSVSSSSK